MYYLAKIFQATGLTVIAIGFVQSFPRLLDRNALTIGTIAFVTGWTIQRFFLRD